MASLFSPQSHDDDCDGDCDWWHDYCEKFCDTENRDREVYRSYHARLENGLHPIRHCNAKAVVAGR